MPKKEGGTYDTLIVRFNQGTNSLEWRMQKEDGPATFRPVSERITDNMRRNTGVEFTNSVAVLPYQDNIQKAVNSILRGLPPLEEA